MGRVKIHIRKLETLNKRKTTFSKRRIGLIKKAYELSVLCGIDVALLAFSPSNHKLSPFSGRSRFEDVLTRFLSLPNDDQKDQETRKIAIQNKESLITLLEGLKIAEDREADRQAAISREQESSKPKTSKEYEDIKLELIMSGKYLEMLQKLERLFCWEQQNITVTSESEFDHRDIEFQRLLNSVVQRKRDLLKICYDGSFNPITHPHEMNNNGNMNPGMEDEQPWNNKKNDHIDLIDEHIYSELESILEEKHQLPIEPTMMNNSWNSFYLPNEASSSNGNSLINSTSYNFPTEANIYQQPYGENFSTVPTFDNMAIQPSPMNQKNQTQTQI